MKLLFLDLDGVVNSVRFEIRRQEDKVLSELPYPLSEFDPICVNYVNEILDKTDAKLILSSDWRFTDGIENIFNKVGFTHPIYGKTCYGMSKGRGYEIQKYIDDCSDDVIAYCIIDDIDYCFTKKQKKHFIHTNEYVGLTEDDVKKAINILNNFNK